MEFLKSLYYSALESTVWKSFLSHFRWIDWLTLAAVFAGFFWGLKKGLTRAFLETVTLVLTLALALEFHPQAVIFLKAHLGFLPDGIVLLTGFLAVAAGCFFIFRFIFWGLRFILPPADVSLVEITLAIVFNILNQVLLLSLLASAIMMGPWGGLKPVFGHGDSYTGYSLVRLADRIHTGLHSPLMALRKAIP